MPRRARWADHACHTAMEATMTRIAIAVTTIAARCVLMNSRTRRRSAGGSLTIDS
jgi:hypothetical protein